MESVGGKTRTGFSRIPEWSRLEGKPGPDFFRVWTGVGWRENPDRIFSESGPESVGGKTRTGFSRIPEWSRLEGKPGPDFLGFRTRVGWRENPDRIFSESGPESVGGKTRTGFSRIPEWSRLEGKPGPDFFRFWTGVGWRENPDRIFPDSGMESVGGKTRTGFSRILDRSRLEGKPGPDFPGFRNGVGWRENPDRIFSDSGPESVGGKTRTGFSRIPEWSRLEGKPGPDFLGVWTGVGWRENPDRIFPDSGPELKAALEKQLESPEARKEMFVKMALLNANSTTKPILRALPLDPGPTIDQMIEACVKHNSTENTVVEAEKRQAERRTAQHDDNKCPANFVRTPSPTCRRPTRGPIPTWEEDTSAGSSPQDEEDKFYTQIQEGTRRELVSDLSVQFENDSIYKIVTGKRALLNGPFDILIIGDPFYKPNELAVIPEVQTLEPGEEIFISVMCLDYPYFLPTGVSIAQAFLLPKNLPDMVPQNPAVLCVQIMGMRKLVYKCTLFSKGEKIKRLGMMDTGADVMLVAKSEWPTDWELEPVSGFISGIGGVATSWRVKHNVVISGPEGKVATVRPFVVRALITLWGQDVLSQWGAMLTINSRDFLVGAAEERACNVPQLHWKQDQPVWVDQWPLPTEKLHALETLVEEQLSKGHIIPSNSSWNTLIFVIKKPGKDKWRLLQDLRKVNEPHKTITTPQEAFAAVIRKVLNDLLEDEETTRKATLQNWAAIDFLLLAHGHGCDEFEGLCCFNLSTHGESIHSKIKAIQGAVQELKIEKQTEEWSDNPFRNWGFKGWVATIVNGLLWIFVIAFVALVTFGCVLKCCQKFSNKVFLINKEGGVVGNQAFEDATERVMRPALPWRTSTP
ncbi:hypothetical protein HGM15179_016834 [Zosterops borbonicus]|uniref:Peptidase A2 domain-containing protein n=1 Tax=Zosterops borbonicus TaxID=364589 RepID=A0A8K1G1X1_9PASS|nr:hypothetical protein HGM15179_016834 [Zosterops borbonicus]